MTVGRPVSDLFVRAISLALCALFIGLVPGGARAQESLSIQLNKLEERENACRAYFVLENGTGAAFDKLTLDLIIFDTEGGIAKRLAIETAPLPAGKTRVKLTDIQGMSCGGISRLLFNGVLACESATVAEEACAALIVPSSRLEVVFDQ